MSKRKGFGNDVNVYRIAKQGVQILVEEKHLNEKSLEVDLSRFGKIRNFDHFLATNQIVLQTEMDIEMAELGSVEKANYRNKVNERFGIISDAILNFNNVFVYFETDMGTESLSQLNSKLDRYAFLAKEEKEYIHVVAISLLDDSYQTRKYYEVKGERRIANIKKSNIYNDDVFEPNLRIVISPFRKTPELIFPAVIRSFEQDIPGYLDQFTILFQEKEHFRLNQIDENVIYSREVLDIHRDSYVFYEVYNEAGNIVDRIAVIIMNIYDLQQNIVMNNMINYIHENILLKYISRMIVVYPTREKREKEVYGTHYSRNILFTDLETMRRGDKERYYISRSKYKMKCVSFIQ